MEDDEQSMCSHADRERLEILVFCMHEKNQIFYTSQRKQANMKEEKKDKRSRVPT